MTIEQVTGILRAILAAIGGSMVARGSMTEEQVAQIGGAIVVIVTAGWSVYANYKQQKTINKQEVKITQQEVKIDELRENKSPQ